MPKPVIYRPNNYKEAHVVEEDSSAASMDGSAHQHEKRQEPILPQLRQGFLVEEIRKSQFM